jgi:hypothetical protein
MTVIAKHRDDLLASSTSVALGDFNDDGSTDLLMGAPQADGPDGSRADAGEAYVILGPLDGEVDLLSQDPDLTIYGALAGDGLGNTTFAGDLDDDGVDDIMVGAPGVTAGFDPRTDQGRLYVFYGGDDLGESAELDLAEDVYDFTVTGSEGFSRLSSAVDLGDVNDDGRTDLVVSSPFAGREPGTPPGGPRTGIGEVYVILGTGQRLTGEKNIAADDYDVLLSGDTEFGQFGASIAVADFNGDGYDDVVTGAHRTAAANGRPSGGAAYVFFGKSDISGRISIQDGGQDMSIVGAGPGSAFGFPVASGDFNGDGVADIAVSAQSEPIGSASAAGSIRIFLGEGDLPEEIDLSVQGPSSYLTGSEAGMLLPTAMAVGDVTSDGIDDLVVSAAFAGADLSRANGGLVYTLMGGSDLPETIAVDDLSSPPPIVGPVREARLGAAIAIGPVDGNRAELGLLAPAYSPSEERAGLGAVFVLKVGPE